MAIGGIISSIRGQSQGAIGFNTDATYKMRLSMLGKSRWLIQRNRQPVTEAMFQAGLDASLKAECDQ